MFQFSAFASPNLCIQFGMTALVALPGFPIQKSSGHSSFDNSPKLIAVYYVFHRLSAPRHPPCALYSLIIHPTPSKPKPLKAGLIFYLLNLSILRHLMFLINSQILICFLIAHFLSIAFFYSVFKLPLRCHPSRRRGGLIRASKGGVKFFFQKKSKKLKPRICTGK